MEALSDLGFGATLTLGGVLGILLQTVYGFLDRAYLQRRGSGLLAIEPKQHGRPRFDAQTDAGKDIVDVLGPLGEAYTGERFAGGASESVGKWPLKARIETTAALLERYADGEPDKVSPRKVFFVETFTTTGELLLMNCGSTPIFVHLDTPQIEGAEVSNAEGMRLVADAIVIDVTEGIALNPGEMRTFGIRATLKVERRFVSGVPVYRQQVAYLEEVQRLNRLYRGLCDSVGSPVSIKLPLRLSFVTAGIRLWHDKPVPLEAKRDIDVMVRLNSETFDETTSGTLETLLKEATESKRDWDAYQKELDQEGRQAWQARQTNVKAP